MARRFGRPLRHSRDDRLARAPLPGRALAQPARPARHWSAPVQCVSHRLATHWPPSHLASVAVRSPDMRIVPS
eukprot:1181211-Prorocentrum_minimum.AAC.1